MFITCSITDTTTRFSYQQLVKKKKQKSSDETKNVRINASQGLCLDVFQIFGY